MLHLHRLRVPALVLALALALTLLAEVSPATAATPDHPERSADRAPAVATRAGRNVLAAGPWATGHGRAEELWRAYSSATGTNKRLLGKMARRPRVLWFGHWFRTGEIRSRIREYIRTSQAGDPRKVVHLAVFRLFPREEAGRFKRLTKAERAAYRAWVREAARGISSSRVAMVLEPDMAVAGYDSADPGVRLSLARYAAQVFGRLPNTAVYLEAGSADWLSVAKAARMLRLAGIRYTRGFALGATHYTALGAEVEYGTRVMRTLARRGLAGKKFVVDTADNGRPFTWKWFYATYDGLRFDNAPPCRKRTSKKCITLGIPPTRQVGHSRWPLTPKQRRLARQRVDGYLWFGRPWQYRQASPFKLNRALQVARTTPWA